MKKPKNDPLNDIPDFMRRTETGKKTIEPEEKPTFNRDYMKELKSEGPFKKDLEILRRAGWSKEKREGLSRKSAKFEAGREKSFMKKYQRAPKGKGS